MIFVHFMATCARTEIKLHGKEKIMNIHTKQVHLQFICNKRQQEKERPLRNNITLVTLVEKLDKQ